MPKQKPNPPKSRWFSKVHCLFRKNPKRYRLAYRKQSHPRCYPSYGGRQSRSWKTQRNPTLTTRWINHYSSLIAAQPFRWPGRPRRSGRHARDGRYAWNGRYARNGRPWRRYFFTFPALNLLIYLRWHAQYELPRISKYAFLCDVKPRYDPQHDKYKSYAIKYGQPKPPIGHHAQRPCHPVNAFEPCCYPTSHVNDAIRLNACRHGWPWRHGRHGRYGRHARPLRHDGTTEPSKHPILK